jgi:organic radical activating enzyme
MRPLLLARFPDGQPEIFATIQGEGASLGSPAIFIRLATCNLACSWCDTPYTWDWNRYDREATTVGIEADELLGRIEALPPRRVVITGGEPLLQRRELGPLVLDLQDRGYAVEVETNGTLGPGELAPLVTQWNVSPKLAHAGNVGLKPLRPAVLREFVGTGRAWFKFVVRDPADLPGIASLQAEAGIPNERVILMPEGQSVAELETRGRWLAERCTSGGYRFSTRLHILLWGAERGR